MTLGLVVVLLVILVLVAYVHLEREIDGSAADERERLVQLRADRYAGKTRMHKPTLIASFLLAGMLLTADAPTWAGPLAALGALAPIIGATAAAGTAVVGGIKAFQKPKVAGAPKIKSPLVGESGKLSPGQKTNLINTTPQGVLGEPLTGRRTLLGG